VVALLREWWAPMLENTGRLQQPGYHAYAILTMCRCLYTLEHGTVVTKAVAARWAQEKLGARWAGLIERAMRWPGGEQLEDLDETLDLIRCTLECAQEYQACTGEA
jgi:hypothetical protein